ncbi:MAG: putative 2-hydroxypenta-2,4-dienoate hydratase [Conexibacter sp.]|nr:putative 2-hydroxypenta-2,4-dienoate hydratase [Conexibacter sp.]
MSPLSPGRLDELAQRLDVAYEQRAPTQPLSDTDGLETADDAYAVQARWADRRIARGDRILGRKIGLTSAAMQEQMGVHEPDFGTLWSSGFFPARNGVARARHDVFLQPRIEGELAFLIGEPLNSPHVSPQLALAVTEAVAPSFEIVDSRIEDWRIKLADTIADNASYGGYTVGPWSRELRTRDLSSLGMRMSRNGDLVAEGLGAAAMGEPARAVAWLLSRLGRLGVGVRAGDVVLSGSLARAVDVAPGDHFMLAMHGEPPLSMVFER